MNSKLGKKANIILHIYSYYINCGHLKKDIFLKEIFTIYRNYEHKK